MLVLSGGRLFDGEAFHDDRSVVIEGGRISAVTAYAERPRGGEQRDLGGGLLAPGYIDVQVNGGGGALLNAAPSVETIRTIATSHRRFGTTGMLPTLITDAPEVRREAIAALREAFGHVPGMLGAHLEGPHLDVQRKGAHPPERIRPMTDADVEEIAGAACGIVMTTLAPNRVSPAHVEALARRGVLVSLGHAEARYDEALAALQAGATAFTHLFNAMSGPLPREPGMVGSALTHADSFVGIIADGHHVHPANLRLAFAAKRRDRFMLISDAMPPAAGGAPEFDLAGRQVVTRNGRLELADGTLAGSALTMDEAVRHVVEVVGLPLADALIMASRAPAEFLRRGHELGRIAPRYRADLVSLDDRLRVRETWIGGVSEVAC